MCQNFKHQQVGFGCMDFVPSVIPSGAKRFYWCFFRYSLVITNVHNIFPIVFDNQCNFEKKKRGANSLVFEAANSCLISMSSIKFLIFLSYFYVGRKSFQPRHVFQENCQICWRANDPLGIYCFFCGIVALSIAFKNTVADYFSINILKFVF